MDVVQRKRAHREALIPEAWRIPSDVLQKFQRRPLSIFEEPSHPRVVPGILSQRELEWSSPHHDATSLLQQLRAGSVTCEELTIALCKRAAIAQQLCNCLSEIMFDEAIARAKDLDKVPIHQQRALHGLPVTVKDSFNIKDIDSSIGITSLCYEPAQTNSLIVDILQEAGAIIIAKTTVPQTMLTADTDSIVFGRTRNIYNGEFGAGGSSGGEGVVIAMGGSAFGIGTDGAGSVRMPAFVNGIIGIRPSGYRFPLDGRAILGKGVMGATITGPVSVTGPLTRSVRDAQLIYRVLDDSKPWGKDPFLLPSPWLELECPDKLRIGVWKEFGHVHALAPVSRAFLSSQERLVEAGHTLVPFAGPSIDNVWQLQKEWVHVQDLRYLRQLVDDEGATEIVKRTGIIYPTQAHPEVTLDRLHDLNSRTAALIRALAVAWHASNIDCLLWIPAPHPAVPFDQYTDLTFTGLFNIIDWPAIVLPTGDHADSRIDSRHAERPRPLGEEDKRVQDLYWDHRTDFDGLPLSIQLIGRRGMDELLLAMAAKVHEAIRRPSAWSVGKT